MRNKTMRFGFTIVELIVVIVIIGILTGFVIFNYNTWKLDTTISQLKSDLTAAQSAMENQRNFNNAYPADINAINSYRHSSDVTVSGGSADGKTYCISAYNSAYPSMFYSITSTYPNPQAGDCTGTVQIGAQVWAAKSANVGIKINSPNSLNPTDSYIQKYCYDDLDSNCNTYGGMYTWAEAMQNSTTEGAQGICPSGFHIPSDGEWQTLESTLGMNGSDLIAMNAWRSSGSVGSQLKVGGGSNFNAKMGGTYGSLGGGFQYIETGPNTGNVKFWTSTKSGNAPIERIIEGPTAGVWVGRFTNDNPGFGPFDYVRCIKNS